MIIMIVNIFITNISTIGFVHICNMNDIVNISMVIIMDLPLSYPIYTLLTFRLGINGRNPSVVRKVRKLSSLSEPLGTFLNLSDRPKASQSFSKLLDAARLIWDYVFVRLGDLQ